MKRKRTGIPVLLACAVIAMTLQPVSAPAATCEKWAGKVVSAQGVVEVKPSGQTQWQAVKLDEMYCPGDTIRTDRKSRADIALYNHPVLRLDQNSTVTLGGMKDERTSLVDLVSGAALFFSRVTRNLEVRTATVNAGVEGTEFFLRVEEGKTEMTVFEGKVLAANAAGNLPVTTGQSAVAEAGKAPVYRVVVRPRDAVQWALYYPIVIDSGPADLKEESGDPRFYTGRASKLLAVGRVDEATADIEMAQKLDPKNSDAFALQSIIAVTQNEKGKALDLARKAVEADPKSATAKIALSYAQQAHFDLPGAFGSLEEAVKLAPGNALAWARLAELHQSFGYLDKSLDAAKRAAALNPDLSRTQTVLGFSHLTRIETKEARGAFEKAITLDSADPLPRLGLGLAKIREGGLDEGRRELEIAMSLDPDSSIIRSYLGKAYFEEKRDKLAQGQFDMAKSLDPMDPTPHFYDAIQKQTVNRPVEALLGMEKAIELNDNRAVYRSRLLLDQDLAARSVSLARIYTDLGFQQRALVEGWNSVNTDPGNYSAHRFLSDSYSGLPRHEIARVSELLQAQLLQPLNLTPVQPRLAESNQLVVAGGGTSNLSFMEFNQLFQRDGATLQASGVLGENSTSGAEIVLSGLYRSVSLSGGWSQFQTDGFRVNNDEKNTIYNIFAQWSISPKTSVQAEYRNKETEEGDLTLKWFPDDFIPGLRQGDDTDTFRLGLHHAFSPGSDLIISFMDSKKDFSSQVTEPGVFFDDQGNQDATGGEIQYMHRATSFNGIAGAGYFKIKGEENINLFLDPDPVPALTLSFPLGTTHANYYLYTYLRFLKNVTFTVGVSYDSVNAEESDLFDRDQWNPKFGITWNPVPNTTLRAAAFRVLKRTLITDQTLEPTQVAGFNQFYDEVNSTDYWVYGIAVDQKFQANMYGGLELSHRDMNLPIPAGTTVANVRGDWKENVGRAYFNWAPHEWVAFNAQYLYQRIERTMEFTFGAAEATANRVPLGINFYHPSGFIATANSTYVNQRGKFAPTGNPFPLPDEFVSDSDTFWLCDAAIGYRLPKRFGLISVGVKNLFDKSFKYFDTDEVNPAYQPDRMFYARVTLSI